MIKSKITNLAFIVLTSLIVVSCSKEDAFNYSDLEHTADWLFPVVTTKVSADQFLTVDNVEFDISIKLTDDVTPPAGFPAPPIPVMDLDSMAFGDPDSSYVKIKSDLAVINLTITNNFPINIKAGTFVEIRNTLINNDVVFRGDILADIAANGGTSSVVLSQVGASQWIDNQLEFYLKDFSSDGSGSDIVNFDENSTIGIRISVSIPVLNVIEFQKPIDYLLTDTTEMDFGGTDGQDETDEGSIENVKINMFVRNGIPLTFSIKAFFLDANNMIIDSIFDAAPFTAPSLDAEGYVITSSITEQKIVAELNQAQFLRVKHNTKHIYYKLDFSSQAEQNFVVESTNSIGLDLTTEITSKISL